MSIKYHIYSCFLIDKSSDSYIFLQKDHKKCFCTYFLYQAHKE